MGKKRIMLTVDDDLYKIVQSLKGFGNKDAEKINKIVVAYLSEHGCLKQP